MTISVNPSGKCKLATITATGTFRMAANGPGGTVSYAWLRKDSTGTHSSALFSVQVAAGDTSAHAVVSDSWTPASSGSDQLVFLNPIFVVPAQSFTCS